MTAPTDALAAAVRDLDERELLLSCELLEGMAVANETAGHHRPARVWRALAAVLAEEGLRKADMLAELDRDLDGGPAG